MDASSKRPMMAAIGCAIILTVGLGSTSLLNAIAVLLVEGMNTDLVTYAFGPMLATIFAFLGSLVGTKLIDRITPKRCLLIGSVCTAIALTLFAMATGPVMWYIGNVINGIVLAIGAHASAAGVLSRFYGERTPTVFGVVVGVMSFIIAGLVFIESLLLQVFDYRTIIYGYAVIVLVLGVFSNVVLIGKVPAMPAGAPIQVADDPAELGEAEAAAPAAPAPPAAAGIALLVMWLSSLSDGMLYGGLVLCALIGPVQILPALFIPQLFGMKDYTAINAVGMGAFYLGGTAVFLIAAAIMQNIGFGMGFIVLAVSGVVACVLFLLAIAASPVRKMMKK